MGYFKHDAVIAAFNCADKQKEVEQDIEDLRQKMKSDPVFIKDNYDYKPDKLVIGPVGQMNAYSFYCFMPDGSKEGWDYSDQMDKYREEFIEIMKKDEWADIVSVSFGGDLDNDMWYIKNLNNKED